MLRSPRRNHPRARARSTRSLQTMTAPTKQLTLPPTNEPVDLVHGSVLFVGTATVILRFAGFTILTDPNFLHAGEHVHLGYGLTSERLTEPALDIEQLPPIDLVLLSHYHGDHFDQLVEKKLRKDVPIVTNEHAAVALKALGFSATLAIDTWQQVVVKKSAASQLRITAMPGQHGPAIVHFALPPVMGSLLEFDSTKDITDATVAAAANTTAATTTTTTTASPDAAATTTAAAAAAAAAAASATAVSTVFRIYISGDTLNIDELKEIPRRFPDIDLGIFHLGGTRVMGVLVTMDAEQGVEAIRCINPHRVIPVHYNDYDVFKSSLDEFKLAATSAGLAARIVYLSHGETYEFEVRSTRERAAASRNKRGDVSASTD